MPLTLSLICSTLVFLAAGGQPTSQPTSQPASQPTSQPTTAPSPLTPAPQQEPYFKLLQVEPAWDITQGSPDCLVGVIDTGFDFFHPALYGRLDPGYFADGVYHTDFATMDAHGTAVTSVIIAHNVAPDGMVGLAPACRAIGACIGMPEHALAKMQQEFFDEHPDATIQEFQVQMIQRAGDLQAFGQTWIDYVTRTTAEAIRYLADHGARVINMSVFLPDHLLGRYPDFARRLDDAFAYAIEKDVVMVIGAGNTGTLVSGYPGDKDTVLVVGACLLDGQRWETTVERRGMSIKQGSCLGPRLSVMAPMDQLLVASLHEKGFYDVEDTPMGRQDAEYDGQYDVTEFGATSLATPIVTSLAALVRSLRPDLSAREVIDVIKKGAVDMGEPGFDELTGHGRIDFLKTLELARVHPTK